MNFALDGEFWPATIHLGAAAMYAGMAALSFAGMRAGMMAPPSIGPGLAAVTADAPEQILVAIAENPALREWVIRQLVPAVASLAVFMAGGGHSADWELRDAEGRIRTRGTSESGGTGKSQPTFPEQLASHTEKKILADLDEIAEPGDIITIRGSRPPCNPGNNGTGCWPAMEKFARERGVKIYYSWDNQVEVFPHQ